MDEDVLMCSFEVGELTDEIRKVIELLRTSKEHEMMVRGIAIGKLESIADELSWIEDSLYDYHVNNKESEGDRRPNAE